MKNFICLYISVIIINMIQMISKASRLSYLTTLKELSFLLKYEFIYIKYIFISQIYLMIITEMALGPVFTRMSHRKFRVSGWVRVENFYNPGFGPVNISLNNISNVQGPIIKYREGVLLGTGRGRL